MGCPGAAISAPPHPGRGLPGSPPERAAEADHTHRSGPPGEGSDLPTPRQWNRASVRSRNPDPPTLPVPQK